MNVRRRAARAAVLGACAALLIVGWYFLAPRQLGGRASYVTTSGSSMEPLLHQGDLAIVYSSPEYRVGDVVAYRNPDLREVVLHRIVALDGDRFVLQGDNNSWLDGYHPEQSQILGAMAIHLPGLGKPLRAVRTPWGMSAMVSVAALGIFGGRRRARRGGLPPAPERQDAPAQRAKAERARGQRHGSHVPSGLIVALAGVAVLALVMSAILFSLSPTTTSSHDVAYEQRGTFSYTQALGTDGAAVYGRDRIESGDPVYLALAHRLEVTFDYAFETDAPVALSGTVDLVAEISDVNGWTRTIQLARSASFDGGDARAQGVLDLGALEKMTDQLERVTGVQRDFYRVTVRPDVSVDGTMAGQSIHRAFAPELRFLLDPLELQLEPADAAAPDEEVVVDPLNQVSGATLKSETTEARTFAVFGLEAGLEPLRTTALSLLVVSLIGLLGVCLGRWRSARRGEPSLIESRYGQWLVPVHPGAAATNGSAGKTVQVESFDSLLRLANHYGHVVLHEEGNGFHAYSVEESGVTYRYLVTNGTRP